MAIVFDGGRPWTCEGGEGVRSHNVNLVVEDGESGFFYDDNNDIDNKTRFLGVPNFCHLCFAASSSTARKIIFHPFHSPNFVLSFISAKWWLLNSVLLHISLIYYARIESVLNLCDRFVWDSGYGVYASVV